jgi:hypothetical protein
MGVSVAVGTGVSVESGTGVEGSVLTGAPATTMVDTVAGPAWSEQADRNSAIARTGRKNLALIRFSRSGSTQGIKMVQVDPPSMVLYSVRWLLASLVMAQPVLAFTNCMEAMLSLMFTFGVTVDQLTPAS